MEFVFFFGLNAPPLLKRLLSIPSAGLLLVPLSLRIQGFVVFLLLDVLRVSPPLNDYFLYFKALKGFHWLYT